MEKNRTNVVYAQPAKAYKGQVRGMAVLSRLKVTNTQVVQVDDDYRVLKISGNIYGDEGIKQVSKALGETDLQVSPEYHNVSISINKVIKSQKQEDFLTEYIKKGASLNSLVLILSVNNGYLNGNLLASDQFITQPQDQSNSQTEQTATAATATQTDVPEIEINDDDLPF